MAEVRFEKPGPGAMDPARTTEYLRYLVDQLEYTLKNLDEKNLTPAFREKIENKEATRG